MTSQEAFTACLTGLMAQGKRSMNEEGTMCAYRGVDGCKCGIGHLIPDELYKPEFEGKIVPTLLHYPEIRDLFQGVSIGLLIDLQSVHDSFAPDCWSERLTLVASKWGLN